MAIDPDGVQPPVPQQSSRRRRQRVLGKWESDPESKRAARSLAFGLAVTHLDAGRDVVMPQLLVRVDVIDQVEAIAVGAGAAFVEVILVAPAEEILRRLAPEGAASHPRNTFTLDELAGQIDHALTALRSHAAARPNAHLVDIAGMDEAAALARVSTLIGW